MTLRLCALVWARPGCQDALAAYEDRVLALVVDHGGRVIQRVRGAGRGDAPAEVHLIEFPTQTRLEDYRADPRRASMAGQREAAVSRTQIFAVEPVEDRL
jgi:uncharacterized protein (DUF1330 family)